MTAIPALTIDSTGVTQPAETDILDGALADIDSAFGGGMNTTSLTTPQAQLATGLTAIIADKNAKMALLTNQVDPAYAEGRFQDAIGRLYFMTRKAAAATTVQVQCVGLVGVTIPVGAMVKATDGTFYAASAAGSIGSDGTVTLSFAAMTTGAIACPAGSITGSPYTSVDGWDTATNLLDGVVGNLVEGRADYEYRRKESVAANGKNSIDALHGALLALDNVIDAYCYENNSNGSLTLQNVTLLPHSIYACVSGGAAADIANAIYTKKNPGADMNGDTTYAVQNTTDYVAPYPTYTMKWQTAVATPVYFAFVLENDSNLPSNIVALAQAAVVAAFNGTSTTVTTARARIASRIYASRYYAAITALSQYAAVLSGAVGTAANPTATSVTMDLDQMPTISAANVSITLGS